MDLVSVQQFLMMKVQVLKFRYAHLNVCQGAEITRYFFSVHCFGKNTTIKEDHIEI